LLAARGLHRLVVPAGLPQALGEALPDGFDFIVDSGLTPAELDTFEGVVTACTVAIAETGTIVLQNVPGQGRRAPTLVPDYHLCVVRERDVVETVPEAMARLAPTAALATTFVSGPSATADIEMTRIKGVHGPRFLDVVLIP
jgi:L-lactate dehydrogenase complex protein LldG